MAERSRPARSRGERYPAGETAASDRAEREQLAAPAREANTAFALAGLAVASLPGSRTDPAAVSAGGSVSTAGSVRRESGTASDPLGGSSVPPDILTALRRRAGSGSALPGPLAGQIGEQLGHDLSQVRVHTDSEAHRIARSVQAIAFTHGNDIYFQQGQYAPNEQRGQHLLAHELSHVAHEAHSPSGGAAATIGRADDPAEHAADRSAERVVAALRRQATTGAHQHQDADRGAGGQSSDDGLFRRQLGSEQVGPVRRTRAVAPAAAAAGGGVIRRVVQIVFQSQAHEMEEPVDPATARIELVDATRTASQVATEDATLNGAQWAHTTSHTVLTNMWVRSLDQKTWLEAWTVVKQRYQFLERLAANWYAHADLDAGKNAWVKTSLLARIQMGLDECNEQLTRGGHDLTVGVWAARPTAGGPADWRYFDHSPTLLADGIDPATHLIKPWKPLLDSQNVAKLQDACDTWMTVRGQIPWTSVKADSYVTGDKVGPGQVKAAVDTVKAKATVSKGEAKTIAAGIIKTFDFFPPSFTAKRTVKHAAAVAARHLIEHFEYHPDIRPAWRARIKTEFLALWKKKIVDEINYEETLSEQYREAKAESPKKKIKLTDGRDTTALHDLNDNWGQVSADFDEMYTQLSPSLS
jgi:hypothetical protein